MKIVGAILAFTLWAGVAAPQNEDERPPKLQRGGKREKGELPPESTPIPLAGRVIVTDENGRVIEQRDPPRAPGAPDTKEKAAPKAPEPVGPNPNERVQQDRLVTIPKSGDETIDKAREMAFGFSEELPNFICKQLTSRYSGEGRRNIQWKMQDRIEADLMFVDGKESLKDVKRNGKLLKGASPQDTGTWSSGEYGTVATDVLATNTDAKFRYEKDSDVGGRPARKYLYSVAKLNSHWRVDFQGNVIYPAYSGGIWFDKENFRVLRVEMSGRQLPSDYPMDVVEMTIDYGMVKISGHDFLLPTHAENLACGRLSVMCSRNEVEYRNYRRFTAESTISTTDTSVTFDGEEKKPTLAEPPQIEEPKKKFR